MTIRNRRQAYRPILRIWAMRDVMYARMENGKRKTTAPNELVVAADQKKQKNKKQKNSTTEGGSCVVCLFVEEA